jgi:hypothetical protein
MQAAEACGNLSARPRKANRERFQQKYSLKYEKG